jgi:signal transduction histidine kinase
MAEREGNMQPANRTRVDYICLAFLHELAEPLTAIACHTAAAQRLSASHKSESPAEIADSLHQISSELIRTSDVIKRFRSYLQEEAKQQMNSVEKKSGEPLLCSD